MELFLNSVWILVVAAGLWSWHRQGESASTQRNRSFVALVMLIVILFPVISVSDDLWSLQNPAETSSSQRRVHQVLSPHSIFPAPAALPEQAFAQLTSGYRRLHAVRTVAPVVVDNPACESIQNRPPPAA